MIIPVIRCAVCNRPVERCETWQDFSDQSWKFRVECHGNIEECSLDRIAIIETDKIVDAVAFAKKSVISHIR